MKNKLDKEDSAVGTVPELQPTEKDNKADNVQSLMYIGPSLKSEMIAHGTAFNIPPDIDTLNEKYPGIGVFFIAIKDIAKTLPQLSAEGTELNIKYKQIKKIVNGGVK